MKPYFFLLSLAWAATTLASASPEDPDACQHFLLELQDVPHDTLTHNEIRHQSLWDGKDYPGCEIKFVTSDSLLSGGTVPNFDALQGTPMYLMGWRVNNSYTADGPGTGVFGIEKESVLCLIRHDQPAYLSDQGKKIQSKRLSITIQCREK